MTESEPSGGAPRAANDHAAVTVHAPVSQTVPLVFSSPHSGRDYTPEFVASTRLNEVTLRRSEDGFVDELFAGIPALGAPLLTANFPRAYCDANREAWELDQAMFEDKLPAWVNTTSPRAGAGFGTIARVVANGEAIYGHRLHFGEAQHRVRECWQPYHDALQGLVEDTRARFGICILIDCHSMPASATAAHRPPPDVVLGDAYGASCAPALVRATETFFSTRRYAFKRNDPYAGGFVTRHYGRPQRGVHALQIEFARRLYMNEATLQKRATFARIAADAVDLLPMLAQTAFAIASQDALRNAAE